jgi:hypothetical protein
MRRGGPNMFRRNALDRASAPAAKSIMEIKDGRAKGFTVIFDSLRAIFDKEKREQRLSNYEYNECKQHRLAQIAKFRVSTMAYLTLTYPDIIILTNDRLPTFLAYSEKGDATICGRYVDRYYPGLDYINDDAPTAARWAAIANYKKSVSAFNKNPKPAGIGEKFDRIWGYDPILRNDWCEIWSRGYRSIRGFDHESLVGARILRDCILIAESTICNPQRNGYFSKAIYDNITADGRMPKAEGVSEIKLQLISCPRHFNTAWASYEFLFIDLHRHNKYFGAAEFRRNVHALSEFMSAIEEHVRTEPSYIREDLGLDEASNTTFKRELLMIEDDWRLGPDH